MIYCMKPASKPSLFFLYLAVFLNIASFSLVFPLLPALAKEFTISGFTLGILAASFAFAQFFLAPLWGTLSDKWGRKPVITLGLAGLSAGFFLFVLAPSVVTLFCSRLLQGAFTAATLPAARAYIADISTQGERLQAMGKIGASLALGFMLGPVFGGMLAEYSLIFPFLAAGIVAFLTFLLILKFLPESLKDKTKESLSFNQLWVPIQRLWGGLRNSSLTPLFILSLLWSFGLSNNQLIIPLLGAEKLHLDSTAIGLGFTLMGMISAVTQFFLLSKITKFLGVRKAGIGGILLMAVCFFLFPFAQLPTFLYLLMAVVSFGSAVSHPVFTALVSEETKEAQGTAMGTATSFEGLGRLLGPLAGGMLLPLGFFIPFLFSGIIIIAAVLLIITTTGFLKKGSGVV